MGEACGVLLLGSSLSLPFFGSLQRPSTPRAEGSLGAEQVREITVEESRKNGRPVNGEKNRRGGDRENRAEETGPVVKGKHPKSCLRGRQRCVRMEVPSGTTETEEGGCLQVSTPNSLLCLNQDIQCLGSIHLPLQPFFRLPPPPVFFTWDIRSRSPSL